MRKILITGMAFYGLLSGLGLFIGSGLSSAFVIPWLTGYLSLLFIVSYQSLFTKEHSNGFFFIMLGIIGLNFIVQLTGGPASPAGYGYFLLAAAATFQPFPRAYFAPAIILSIEAMNLLVSGRAVPERWTSYTVFGLSLLGVVFIITPFTGRIRNQARIARERYSKLLSDADAVDPLAGGTRVEALTERSRQAKNVSVAVEREGAFKGIIDMISEFVPAHTYALFLDDRGDGIFTLRAIRSASRHITPVGTVLFVRGSGLIGICAAKSQPQHLPEMVIPVKSLKYYTSDVSIKSFLAVPIIREEKTAGVLVVDSLEQGAFSLEIQDMLMRFGPFFSQIIEKIRISQELDIKARNFSALHEMSAVLSSSFESAEVLNKLTGQIKSVIDYDFCAFVLYDDKTDEAVVTALRGYDARFAGARFPLIESAFMGRMRHQRQPDNPAPSYYLPDLGERGREIGLFPIRELQQPLRSLYGRPLVAGEKFIGGFFMGSLRTNAFTEFHRHILDTLMNQVSVVIDNANLHRQIRDMAYTDGLTGLLNHRTFMDKLEETFKLLDRDEYKHFSLLFLDIDHFKKINDTYGHPVGDITLKRVSGIIKEVARSVDFVARYGGEEFAIGMISGKKEDARQMAERIRKTVENTAITAGRNTIKCTLSIGVATVGKDVQKKEDLIRRADEALYCAKQSDRNCVCLHDEMKHTPLCKS